MQGRLSIAAFIAVSIAPLCAGLEERKERVSPVTRWDNDFFLQGDYLFWQVEGDGLAYGIEMNRNTTEILDNDQGSVQNLPFRGSSGLRLGLGWRIPHDKWEILAVWTSLYNHTSGMTTESPSPPRFLFPEWTPQIASNSVDGVYITAISSLWHTRLNIVDGMWARYFMVTRCLALKPHMGVRGMWLHELYTTNVRGGENGIYRIVQDNTKVTSQFSGVGPRAFLDTEWGIIKTFSIYADIGFSLLYGTCHMTNTEYLSTSISPSTAIIPLLPVMTLRDAIRQVYATADMALGFRYDQSFWSDSIALRVEIGWELNDFFQQNKLKHFNTSDNSFFSYVQNNQDIAMQGLSLSFRLDF